MGAKQPAFSSPAARVVVAGAAVCIVWLLFRLHSARVQTSIDADPALAMGAQLLAATVVFRHGARAPLNDAMWADREWLCPKEYEGVALTVHGPGRGPAPPILDDSSPPMPKGNCTQGTLTLRGYQDALALGEALRTRYVGPGRLVPAEGCAAAPGGCSCLWAHTTCIRRTVATLRGVLTGMFPGAGDKLSFAVDAVPELDEYMYAKASACPALTPALEQLWAEAHKSEPAAAAAKVAAALQLPSKFSWGQARDTLAAMQAAGLPMPEGLTPGLWQLITSIATKNEVSVYAGRGKQCRGQLGDQCRAAIRLAIGPLVWRLMHGMKAARACSNRWVGGAGIQADADGGEVPPGRRQLLPPLDATASAIELPHKGAGGEPGQGSQQHQQRQKKGKWEEQHKAKQSKQQSKKQAQQGDRHGGKQQEQKQQKQKQAAKAPKHEQGERRGQAEGRPGKGKQPQEGAGQAGGPAAAGSEPGAQRRRLQRQGAMRPKRRRARGPASATGGGCAKVPRLRLFSGHDTTIMPLLAVLGQRTTSWPPFAANVAIELWQTNNRQRRHYVRALYGGQALPLGSLLGPSGSGGLQADWVTRRKRMDLVTLEEFEVLVGDYSLDDESRRAACAAAAPAAAGDAAAGAAAVAAAAG